MQHRLAAFTAAVVLLCPRLFVGQPRKPRLRPTEFAAKTVGDLQNKLAVELNRETLEDDRARHKRQFEQLKNTVTSFVVTQLEAEPEIESWQLRSQLIRVLGVKLGVKYEEHTPDHLHEPPYVFRVVRSKNDDPIVWALAYREDTFYGFGGSWAVVESYVLENGNARLAGRGGAEMDGYDLKAEQIMNPSGNSTSILTHGILQWSSGHELPAGRGAL